MESRDIPNVPSNEEGGGVTQANRKKVDTLLRITRENLERVKKNGDSPFSGSAAKYYPALKKLATK
jgi:hypothetical protein